MPIGYDELIDPGLIEPDFKKSELLNPELKRTEPMGINSKFSSHKESTSTELVEVLDINQKDLMKDVGLDNNFILLVSKVGDGDIVNILNMIWKIKEKDKTKSKLPNETLVLIKILKQSIIEKALIYLGFSKTDINDYFGKGSLGVVHNKPIDIKLLLKLVAQKDKGILDPFRKLGLFNVDNLYPISIISSFTKYNLKENLETIINIKENLGNGPTMDDLHFMDEYNKKQLNRISFDKLEKDPKGVDNPMFQIELDTINRRQEAQLMLSNQLKFLRFFGLDFKFNTTKFFAEQSDITLEDIKKGIERILSMKSQLIQLKEFGFTIPYEYIVSAFVKDEFIEAQIEHIVLLIPRFKQLQDFGKSFGIKIRISLPDILKYGGSVSDMLLDRLIAKKEIFAMFFYMLGKTTVTLGDLTELEYIITNEKALTRYIKLKQANIVVMDFKLKHSKDVLLEIDEKLIDSACRLSNMGMRIDIDDITELDLSKVEKIFQYEDIIKTWLGTDKKEGNRRNNSGIAMAEAATTSHHYKIHNFDKSINYKLYQICLFPTFSEFAQKYESFQLGELDLDLDTIKELLEKYSDNMEELFSILGKFKEISGNTSFKQSFIKAMIFDELAYYKLPETTVDELFLSRLITSNNNNIEEAMNFLSHMGYDIDRNSGVYFACIRRLVDGNAWHNFEYLQYLYDISNIEQDGITDDNWIEVLGIHSIIGLDDEVPKEIEKTLKDIFSPQNLENKNFVLRKMQEFLNNFLSEDELPNRRESMLFDVLSTNGLDNLSYIEGMAKFLNILIKSFQEETTTQKTKDELKSGISNITTTLVKKGWEDADIIDFLNIGTDILESAPSFYSTYLELFQELTPKQLKDFYKNIYPYYHIELILTQEVQDDGNFYYNPRKLVNLRQNIEILTENIKKTKNIKDILATEQNRIQDNIQQDFQVRFGIQNVPDTITVERMKSIQNHILYLANVRCSTDKKAALIGLFLALKLNGDWDKFRAGEDIQIGDYMVGDKINLLTEYMREREKNQLSLNIADLPENFQSKLQEETVSQIIGEVEDIDIRLMSIESNITELIDEDIYQGNEKIILGLLKRYGKKVGKALAMKFRELNGTELILLDEDKKIIDILTEELSIKEWTEDIVKGLQVSLKSISPITNFIGKVTAIDIKKEIELLDTLKVPSDEIISIFVKLGEDFSSDSGVKLISNDVQYLKILIAKETYKLTEEEKQLAIAYLDETESQILKLESIKDKIETLFDNMSNQLKNTSNPILQDRIKSLRDIIYTSTGNKKSIITKMTTDLDTVITNIRACLSCKKKECNNDTNLTFGDSNRFFMTSYANKLDKSFSDQLVTLLESNHGPTFVMDIIYGERVPDVLLAHILCVFKKIKGLGTNEISIFIPNSIATGCHMTEENMNKQLVENSGDNFSLEKVDKVKITIGKSASGDAYHEFGNIGARKTGETEIGGFILKLK